jgi:hypothetical protein
MFSIQLSVGALAGMLSSKWPASKTLLKHEAFVGLSGACVSLPF